MSLLYDKVVNIINKSPADRQDGEIEQILPWFRKKSDLFKSLHTGKSYHVMLNTISTSVIDYDIIVIEQGAPGATIFCRFPHRFLKHQTVFLKLLKHKSSHNIKVRFIVLVSASPLKKNNNTKSISYFLHVSYAGKSFGELALINADCVRNATIIADEATDLLSVDRDLYNRSLRAFQTHEFEQRKDFVSNFPMFHSWAPRYKKMMAMSLKKHVLQFEDTIVKQGSSVDGIHFIIKGQVKIRVDPNQHPSQYQSLYPLGDIADLEKEKARELLRKEMNLERLKTADKKSTYQRRAAPQADPKKMNQKPLELCLAGAIDVIGDLEMAVGLTTYSQTVECTEESIIFHLDQRNYDRLIEKRNPGAVEMLKDIVHTKLTLHFSRLNEDSIPLYRYFLYILDEKEKDARLNVRVPRTKTPEELEINVDNLQKGPLVNMYGPGSVFYLIRKRAKEMKARQRRRQNNSSSRFGVAAKSIATAVTMGSGKHIYGVDSDEVDGDVRPASPTASIINLYGAPGYIGGDSRPTSQLCDPEDWASSDSALSELEEKLTKWHNSLPTVQKGTCVVPLHRYQYEDENKPKPGNKVYVKLRVRPKNVSFIAFPNSDKESLESKEVLKSPYMPRTLLTRAAQHFTGVTKT
ncbi:unnamed protein product [Lymnaea stagnalis]|uniref:Cyclic nucleotide-binding domain-containing protein n=1 Tax=Lymnaea stagnalis TaxID=6523 RepID=A0AAV2HGZ9_LYMST